MIDYTPPPALIQCITDAAERYHISTADIIKSLAATQASPQRFSVGLMGIPIAYEAILPLYGFDNYQVEHDDCTNIQAGALAIAFDQQAGQVQVQMRLWQGGETPVPLRERASRYASLLNWASQSYRVPVALLEAIITQESGFQPDVVSPKGAIGLMQLMPDTARGLGVNPYDVEQNIAGGAALISSLIVKYSGDLSLALAAYNAGSANVDRYGGVPPFAETQKYVPSVEGLYSQYSQKNH
jgi:soluble lytic murein transglycosylase-like protein